MVGKWFVDKTREDRYYYTLKNLGISDVPKEDMYRAINMPITLKRYIRTNVNIDVLLLVKSLDRISALNKECIRRTFI